jgi:hypothetical protein
VWDLTSGQEIKAFKQQQILTNNNPNSQIVFMNYAKLLDNELQLLIAFESNNNVKIFHVNKANLIFFFLHRYY